MEPNYNQNDFNESMIRLLRRSQMDINKPSEDVLEFEQK